MSIHAMACAASDACQRPSPEGGGWQGTSSNPMILRQENLPERSRREHIARRRRISCRKAYRESRRDLYRIPAGEDRIFPFRCCGGWMISAPMVRWQECRVPKAFPLMWGRGTWRCAESVQRHRRNEAKRSGVPLAVDEGDTRKSGTLFADPCRFAQNKKVAANVATSARCAPQARCPQAIGSAAEAWRCAGSAQRHLCNEAKRSGSEGVYNRAWRRAIKRATAPL